MNNKEFIPYEQALILKELGFEEECLSYYPNSIDGLCYAIGPGGYKNIHDGYVINRGQPQKGVAAPLYQQAFRWFEFNRSIRLMRQVSINGDFKYVICTFTNYTLKPVLDTLWFYSPEELDHECLLKIIEVCQIKK